jgi:hypothetical protein
MYTITGDQFCTFQSPLCNNCILPPELQPSLPFPLSTFHWDRYRGTLGSCPRGRSWATLGRRLWGRYQGHIGPCRWGRCQALGLRLRGDSQDTLGPRPWGRCQGTRHWGMCKDALGCRHHPLACSVCLLWKVSLCWLAFLSVITLSHTKTSKHGITSCNTQFYHA